MLSIAHDQGTRDQLKDISFRSIVVDYTPQKEEQHRTILTVGGNLIDYAGYVSIPTADTTTSKIITQQQHFHIRVKRHVL